MKNICERLLLTRAIWKQMWRSGSMLPGSKFWPELFHNGAPCNITSRLIYSANQWTGFYIIGTSVIKKSNKGVEYFRENKKDNKNFERIDEIIKMCLSLSASSHRSVYITSIKLITPLKLRDRLQISLIILHKFKWINFYLQWNYQKTYD